MYKNTVVVPVLAFASEHCSSACPSFCFCVVAVFGGGSLFVDSDEFVFGIVAVGGGNAV